MGEHVRDETFRVVEISVQRAGGAEACFIRNPSSHKRQLNKFFARTGKDYTRFNYLGEWHSHPSFDAVPSPKDVLTMQALVGDPAVGVTFLVLMVTKLSTDSRIEASAMAFTQATPPTVVPIATEGPSQSRQKGGVLQRLRNVFRI